MQELIKRDYHLGRLIDKKENGMVKVITGVRRCGKSKLLFELYYEWLIQNGVKPEQIITIALDSPEHEQYRDPKALYEHLRSEIINSEMYYIMIDEVQYAISDEELKKGGEVRLYNVLNGLLRLRNVDIYVTGLTPNC